MAIQLQGGSSAGIPLGGSYVPSTPVSGSSLQGGSPSLQGSSPTLQAGTSQLQGGAINIQGSNVNPQNLIDPTANGQVQGASTVVDPAAAQAAAAAAAQAAQVAQLKGQIGDLVNTVKGIYDGRYGQVDSSAAEQAGKLNDRFGKESASLTSQIGDQNQQAGAAYAGNGTYDSSYRGNSQDTITKAGNQQIDTLGQDLHDNLATVAQWVNSQKAGFDAGKGSADTIVQRLASETDPNSLISLRNQIDNQIATLQGQSADNNTSAQNRSALETIAPSTARATQLKTTLSSILGGNADATTKAAIGSQLIASADLTPTDQSKLLQAFHTDLAAAAQTPQQQDPNAPTA